MSHRLFVFAEILGLIWMVGCQPVAQPPTGTAAPGTVSGPSPAVATSAPTFVATDTPTTASTAPAISPTVESSPLDISALKAKSYPGSAIVVDTTLSSGPGYNRYIVSYQSDELTLHGLLTVPTGTKPAGGWPVILLNHGYIPPTEYSTEQSYAGIVAPLAEAGYIVFKPDYRGHANSPGTPHQPYVAPDYVTDSLNALASIKQYPDANPDKVGVWGHSMGGNITLHELILSHDFKAAVLMAGVVGPYSDILDWFAHRVATGVLTTQNDQETDQLLQQMVAAHGTPQANPGYWNAIDPTYFTSDITTPVLVQVGSADNVVPPSFSEELTAQLQGAGKSVSFHLYSGADHNMSPDTGAAMTEAVAFFNQYLK
jgi:uncharacterized protein